MNFDLRRNHAHIASVLWCMGAAFVLFASTLPAWAAPAVTISGSGAFPNTTSGGSSGVQTITITNSGVTLLTVSAITNSDSLRFKDTTGGAAPNVAHYCGVGSDAAGAPLAGSFTLNAGASCSLNLIFTPNSATTFMATITLTDDAAGSPRAIALSGTGTVAAVPVFSPSATSFSFPARVVSTTSGSQTLTITNTGGATLNFTGAFTLTGDFAKSTTCLTTLAPASSCTVSLMFSPTAAGARSGSISIPTNVAGSPHVIALSGNGFAANPSSLTFASTAQGTQSLPQTITLSNSDAAAITLGAPSASPTEYFISATTCAASLPAASSCTITVKLSPFPTSAPGTISGGVNIATSAGSMFVGLSGTIATYSATALPSPVAFPNTVVLTNSASQTVTFTNNASGTANISAVNLTGTDIADFQVMSTTCTGIVNPAATCTATVRFTPQSLGAKTANVRFGSDGSSTLAALTGNGVSAPPVITSANTASGVSGSAFTYSITATNTPTSFGASGLPTGLTVAISTGVISGTPSVTGTFNATITATNAGGTGTQTLTITISAATIAPIITSAAPPNGTVGTAYSHTFTASGTAPITWSIATGTLPAGLTLNATSGILNGTPTIAGAFSVTIQAANGAAPNATQSNTIVIAAATIAPAITSAAPPNGTVGTVYSHTFTASGTTPITWSVATGTLPTGLSLNSTSGVLSGTPTTAGSFSVTIQAANGTLPNATQSANISIAAATIAPAITSAAPPNGTVGAAYSHTFTASGTTPITWSVASGTLPSGLALNSTSGLLSGAPTAAGSFSFAIQAVNGTLPNATQSVTLVINAATVAPIITSTSPVSGTVGTAYSHTFTASGSTPITWSVASGTLPAGLTLNAASGILNGTPTTAGAFTFTIQAANGTSPNASQNITINVNAAPAAPTITFALSPTSITTGGTTVGILTISNSNANSLTANAFTFAYIPGLVNAASPNASSTCTGAAITATPGASSYSQTTSFTIPASGSCTFSSTVTTNTAGTYTGAVPAGLIVTSAGSSSASNSVTLIVTVAPAPAVTLSPTSVNFGARTVNTTSPATAVTLTNSGTGPLTINSITGSGDFGFTSTCPISTAQVAAGANCAINVTFTPLTVAAISGVISVASNAIGSPHRINLSGSGTAAPVPGISITPAALAFAAQTVNTTSPTQNVTVINTGFANLALSSIAVAAPFIRTTLSATASPPDCGSSLAPGSSCQIGVAFNPTSIGVLNGVVSIIDNAEGSPHTIALSGAGTPVPVPVISVTGPIAFGDQIINSSSVQNLTISNTGTATLTLSAITLTGTNAASFTLTGQNGCTNIASASSCTLNLAFTPTTAGTKTAQINITSNAQNAAVVNTITLSGNGILAPRSIISLTTTAIGFGNVIFGGATPSQIVTMTNIGGQALTIASAFVIGDYLQTNNCGTSLAPQATCTINIVFTPLGQGIRVGEFVLNSNAATSPNRIQLSGTGCRWFSQAQSRYFLASCG